MLVEMFFWRSRPGKCSTSAPNKNEISEIYQKMTTPSLKHPLYTIETPYIPYIPKNVKLGILYIIETNNKNSKISKHDSMDAIMFPTWKDWLILQILSPLDFLGGGWTNPFEKYVRQIGSFPQSSAGTQKKYLKPPPRFHVSSTKQMTLDSLLEIGLANL